MDLRNKLINLRKEKNYTQEQLAQQIGISVSTIKNYESKKKSRTPDINILQIYAKFFNVSLDYLIDDSINNKTLENINIEKILNLSDKAIENLKNHNHNATNLLLESEQFDSINSLLDLYFKFLYLLSETKQKVQNDNITDIANNISEIINVYKSFKLDNPQISLYSYTVEDIDEDIYLDVLSGNKENFSNKELLNDLNYINMNIFVTFTNALKTVKLELLEEYSKFLSNDSNLKKLITKNRQNF